MYVVETDRFLQKMKTADIIFNTIPERILSAKQLSYVRKSTWIFDIASGDGGVDYAAARKMGVQAVKLPGFSVNMHRILLPGLSRIRFFKN